MQIKECQLETLYESLVKLGDWSKSKLLASGIPRHTAREQNALIESPPIQGGETPRPTFFATPLATLYVPC
jgi:hypothetical protein